MALPDVPVLLQPDHFSPAQTFECGQCFRWDALPDGSYRGVVRGKVLTVSQRGEAIVLEGASQEEYDTFFERYFDQQRDYGAVCRELSALDPTLSQACSLFSGVRILRQEPWEALCSFIFSQNNNIPRIRGIISRFCEQFGEPCAENVFAFPSPERIAQLEPEALAPIRSGFRAKYIIDAARRVAGGALNLEEVAVMELGRAREALQTVHGVGPKVAECVLLYGMGRLEAFPLDVWIKRVMAQFFPGKQPDFFGPCAGIAQQYLFCYCRHMYHLDRPEVS